MTHRAIPIVALDVPTGTEALRLARSLGSSCSFYKVGSQLFTAEGPSIVRELQEELGADVFLDLKFHDIPNTVAGAVRSARELGVRLVTVHASGGGEMLRAAQDASGGKTGVLAVTVLTSLDAEGVGAAWGRQKVDVSDEVLRLAGTAAQAGVHGIVCAGAEAARVREAYDELALLIPGIRLEGGPSGDQKRVMSPREAQDAGARYIILGRAVTGVVEPAEAMKEVLASLA
jgi:orotidine-5'-phosphate decarboxylase